MTVKMTQTIQEERYRWVLPTIEKRLTYDETLKVCLYSKRSLERWVAAYRRDGIGGLVPKSTEPKTQPNETSIELKEDIITLRKQTGLCAKKLHWRLKQQGIHIHPRTIGKILKKEGLVRTYRLKKVKYKYLKVERQPGELLEMDVKYVPGAIEGL